MKKSFFRTLPAVILFVSAIVVLGGCEKRPVVAVPHEIDLIDTTKIIVFTHNPFKSGNAVIINTNVDNISVRLTKKDDIHYNCNMDVKMYYTTFPEGWKKCYWASQKIDSKAKIEISINKHH